MKSKQRRRCTTAAAAAAPHPRPRRALPGANALAYAHLAREAHAFTRCRNLKTVLVFQEPQHTLLQHRLAPVSPPLLTRETTERWTPVQTLLPLPALLEPHICGTPTFFAEGVATGRR